MNKKKAQAMADVGVLTISDLRNMIARTEKAGRSSVNAAFSKEMACKIYDDAIEGRADDECPPMYVYSPSRNKRVSSPDRLLFVNVIRDCARKGDDNGNG
jgi:hypothetical protein